MRTIRTAVMILFALWLLAGCSTLEKAERGLQVSIYERHGDDVTSATIRAGERPALTGEWQTTATVTMPSGLKIGVADAKSKDTIGNLGAAAIGLLMGGLVMP